MMRPSMRFTGGNFGSVRAIKRNMQRHGVRFTAQSSPQHSPFARSAQSDVRQVQTYSHTASGGGTRNRFASTGLQALLLVAPIAVVAQASEASAEDFTGSLPQFVQGQHLYFHPSTSRADFVANHGALTDLSQQFFASLNQPFYVVFFDRLTGDGDHGKLTANAAFDVQKAWKSHAGFEHGLATVIAIAITERRLSTNPGIVWQQALNFYDDERGFSTPVNDFERRHFVPLARNDHMAAGVRKLLEQMDRKFSRGVESAERGLRLQLSAANDLLASEVVQGAQLDTEQLQGAVRKAEAILAQGASALQKMGGAEGDLREATSTIEKVASALHHQKERIATTVHRGEQLLREHPQLLSVHQASFTSRAEVARTAAGGRDVEAMKRSMEGVGSLVRTMDDAVSEQSRLLSNRRLTIADAEQLLNSPDNTPIIKQYPKERAELKARLAEVRSASLTDLAVLRERTSALRAAYLTLQSPVDMWWREMNLLRDAELQVMQLSFDANVLRFAIDTAAMEQALTRLPAVRRGYDLGAARTLHVDLTTEMDTVRSARDAAVTAQRLYETRRNFGIGAGVLALLAGGLWWRRRRRENKAIRSTVGGKVANALGDQGTINIELRAMGANIDRLNLTRERVQALRDATGETADAFTQLSSQVLQVFSGLEQLEARMLEVQTHLGLDNSLATAREARDKLTAPIEINTGTVKSERRALFAPPPEPIVRQVDPVRYMTELQNARTETVRLLDRIDDALQAAGRDVHEDYAPSMLDPLRTMLQEAGLPEAWIASHPLNWHEAVWETLEAYQSSDPLGYMSALQRFEEIHQEYADEVRVLRDAAARVETARESALAVGVDYAGTVMTDRLNPEARQEAVTATAARFSGMILHPETQDFASAPVTTQAAAAAEAQNDSAIDAIDKLATELELEYALLRSERQQLAENVRMVAGERAVAADGVRRLERSMQSMERDFTKLSARHHPEGIAAVLRSKEAARRDLAEAKQKLAQVDRLLAENKHTEARAMVGAVNVEISEMDANEREYRARYAAAEKAREQAPSAHTALTSAISRVERAQRADVQQLDRADDTHRGAQMAQAQREHRDAQVDLQSAAAAAARAQVALAEHRYADALHAIDQSHQALRAARQDQAELDAIVQQLADARSEYTRRYNNLSDARSTAASQVRSYDGSVSSYLAAGDRARDALNSPNANHPVDYNAALRELSDVSKAWDRGVSRARSAYRAEQARIRAEREAQRRREAAEARAAARRAARRAREAAASRSSSSSISIGFGGSGGGSSGVSWGGSSGGGGSGGGSAGVGW